jgi:hypothetical protein
LGTEIAALKPVELSAVPGVNSKPLVRNATVVVGVLIDTDVFPLTVTLAVIALVVNVLETPSKAAFALKLVKRRIRVCEGPGGSNGTPQASRLAAFT